MYQNGEFAGTGMLNGALHIFRLPPVPVTLSDKVTLEGTTNPAQSATFTLRPVNGTPATTLTQTLGADSSFSPPNISPDSYTLLVHVDGYLQNRRGKEPLLWKMLRKKRRPGRYKRQKLALRRF